MALAPLYLHQAFSNSAQQVSVEALDHARQSNCVLHDMGIYSKCTPRATLTKHPADPNYGHLSAHSDDAHALHHHEWYYIDLDVQVVGGELVRSPAQSGMMKLFHGTECGSALKILQKGEGFIVGPGTHGVRGKSWSGCWAVPTLSDAVCRTNPHQYTYKGDFTRFCCPVVFELSHAAIVPKRFAAPEKFVFPGEVGTSMPGLIFWRVHINLRFCVNYMRLESPLTRHRLATDFYCRRCACEVCGAVCFPEESDEWWSWQKSNKKLWYRAECYHRTVSNGRCWL